MTLNQSALLELTEVLRTADGGQVMRLMLSAMLQALVDAEATAHIGAGSYEHTRRGIQEGRTRRPGPVRPLQTGATRCSGAGHRRSPTPPNGHAWAVSPERSP